jgi:pyruvate ferredoxin oxidoreductase alpha subunit/phenylglyoxylate dehydrogenase alpha subunit
MSIVTRDGITPQSVWGGQQDAMTVRETGWIHMYCETCQEILDTVIMAYKIAENRDVMLPVNVNHDGNYLSYGVEKVELPEEEEVDAFLGEKNTNWHVALDPDRPMAVDPLTGGAGGVGPSLFVKYRKGHCKGMQNALRVITEVHQAWGKQFGRHYAPLVEEYRLDDADYAIVTIGSMSGAGKDAVDAAREAGEKVGLIKIKTFRPFPLMALREALAKVKAVGVVDRSVSFAWNSGPVYQELLSALYFLDNRIPAVSFVGGLAGADITIDHFKRVIETTARTLQGEVPSECIWLNEND